GAAAATTARRGTPATGCSTISLSGALNGAWVLARAWVPDTRSRSRTRLGRVSDTGWTSRSMSSRRAAAAELLDLQQAIRSAGLTVARTPRVLQVQAQVSS